MKHIITAVLFLFMLHPVVAQNDNACQALEIPCTSPYVPLIGSYLHYETQVALYNTPIANFSTNYAISGSQCANLPNGPTLFYKVTVNTNGLFTFLVRPGDDNINFDGIYDNSGNGVESNIGNSLNFAVWKNVDCNSIISGTAPYPNRISLASTNLNNCPYYCRNVTGLDISQPPNDVCENGGSNNGLLSGMTVAGGDILIIAISGFHQHQVPNGQGQWTNIPMPMQIIFGGPWGGGGTNVKCCDVQYNLTDVNGYPKTQFCLGEQVVLRGAGVTSSSFEIELSDINNNLLDKRSFPSATPNGMNITDIFPSTNYSFSKFTNGVTYKIKVIARSPCGCAGIFLDFNFKCCPIDASFSLNHVNSVSPDGVELVSLQGSSPAYGTHEWKLYNFEPVGGSLFTKDPIWSSQSVRPVFSTPVAGPCYFVKHSVTNDCGSDCSYLRFCEFNCEDKSCALTPPVNLNFSNNVYTWDQVPTATSYIIQLISCDRACCVASPGRPQDYNIFNISVPQSPSPSHAYSATDFDGLYSYGVPPCYSWKVAAVCQDGSTSPWGYAQSSCLGDPNASICAYMRPGSSATGITSASLTATDTGMAIDLYPNPTNGVVSIRIDANTEVEFNVSIYDSKGSSVQTFGKTKTNDRKSSINWDTRSLGKGMYLVKITTSDGKTVIKKLIVE